MADPTIQTFCCHQPDKADSSVDIMQAFNSNSYSTVCLISSSIGILGAVYQVKIDSSELFVMCTVGYPLQGID